jgi:hypothetical protein
MIERRKILELEMLVITNNIESKIQQGKDFQELSKRYEKCRLELVELLSKCGEEELNKHSRI